LAVCRERGDEPLDSGATELVTNMNWIPGSLDAFCGPESWIGFIDLFDDTLVQCKTYTLRRMGRDGNDKTDELVET
jgi:hypothetical protein